ncbi:MAG TPA: VLRF1 family aeRF1-type release factor, partial [Nitrolancea sp.]|nr:VLRF1 family aeRF1-type release factor [Nitrolancea sp.]
MRSLPQVYTDLNAIPDVLQALRETAPPGNGVLSVYLDTSVHRIQGQAYRLAFREAGRTIRSDLETAPRPEQKAFEAADERATQYLANEFVPRNPGLALFTSADPDYFFAVPLPQQPADTVTWSPEPQLAPLEEALDEFERIAVALIDKQSARLFTVYLGEIQEERTFESDVPGKRAPGDWPRRTRPSGPQEGRQISGKQGIIVWAGMSQDRQKRRHYEHARHHLRRTAHKLMEILNARPFDRLILAGPEEATVLLEEDLSRPLRGRLSGRLILPVTASESEVLQATLQEAEAIERRVELEMVNQLIEAATTPRAELGLAATMDALADSRVHTLFLTATFSAAGTECPTCGRLAGEGSRCPACGEAVMTPVELR